MMRRYADAIRTFSSILLYIQRTKQLFQTRTYQNDQVSTLCVEVSPDGQLNLVLGELRIVHFQLLTYPWYNP